MRYAHSSSIVSRVNEMFKVRAAACCIRPTVPDRSGSSDSDVLKVQRTAQFRRQQGCVWTDLYWDRNRMWLSDGLDGFVMGLKHHVAQ